MTDEKELALCSCGNSTFKVYVQLSNLCQEPFYDVTCTECGEILDVGQ